MPATLTTQLVYWLAVSFLGWLAEMILTYRTFARWQVFKAMKQPDALIDGTFNQFTFETIGLAAWSCDLAIGMAALFDTAGPPVGQTLIGQLIVAGLIAQQVALAGQTIFSLVLAIRQIRT